MALDSGSTRFAAWTRAQAQLALAVTLLVTGACLHVALTGVTRPVETRAGDTDVDIYHKVVQRIRSGENPYDALEHVFQEYNYPVRSVFNYRPPLLSWFLGHLPSPVWGQVLLALVMIATALMSYTIMRRDGGSARAAIGVMAMLGAFAYGFVDDMYLYTEVWSGTLIAFSVCSYTLGWRLSGFFAGLLALFFRELALAYAVVCMLFAARQGQRREGVAWGVGLALYGLSLALHFMAIAPRIPASAGGLINGSGWVHFGGLAFLLTTCRINLLLFSSPPWVTALYLPFTLLGLWGWRGETSLRIRALVGLYFMSFSVVGSCFNAYWGLMYALLLPFGLVWVPTALRDLFAAGFRRPVLTGTMTTPVG